MGGSSTAELESVATISTTISTMAGSIWRKGIRVIYRKLIYVELKQFNDSNENNQNNFSHNCWQLQKLLW